MENLSKYHIPIKTQSSVGNILVKVLFSLSLLFGMAVLLHFEEIKKYFDLVEFGYSKGTIWDIFFKAYDFIQYFDYSVVLSSNF